MVTKQKESKRLRKASHERLKPIQISELGRTNLMDFEVLKESEYEQQHYFHQVHEKKARYDALNWRGFETGLNKLDHQLTYSLVQ